MYIIKHYVYNNDQYTRKTAIPQSKVPIGMGRPGFATTAENYIQTREKNTVSAVLHAQTFSITSAIFIKRLSFLLRNKVIENYCFLTLYLNVIMERSLFWYIRNLGILANTYITTFIATKFSRKVWFCPCLIEHTSLSQVKIT